MDDHIKQIAQTVFDENQNVSQFGVSSVPFHTHNGSDSNRINASDLVGKKQAVSVTLSGVAPQTAGNYSSFFIVPYPITISQIQAVYTVTNGGALTLYVEKLTGTNAPGSGTSVQTGTFNLNTTANTNQTAVLTPTIGVIQLATGDRLGLVKTGTLTSIANLTVTLILTY